MMKTGKSTEITHLFKFKNNFFLLLFSCFLVGCGLFQNDGFFSDEEDFSDGHDWVMPDPPAEFNFKVIDSKDQPIPNAAVFVYWGDERLDEAVEFFEYDSTTGYQTNAEGEVTVIYLSNPNGGYEVPFDAEFPPGYFLHIQANGFQTAIFDIQDFLFDRSTHSGEKQFETEEDTLNLKIINQTISLE